MSIWGFVGALLVAPLLCLPSSVAARDSSGDHVVRSIEIEVETGDPVGRGERALFGSTNDALSFDFGGLCLPFEGWRDRVDLDVNFLEHGGRDRLRYAVPEGNDRREPAGHFALLRLPAGRRRSDLRRCRMVLDHGTSYRAWFAEGLRIRIDEGIEVDVSPKRWFGDAFGNEWTLPDFPSFPATSTALLADRLDLELTVEGGPPWAEDPSMVGLTMVFNLGGRSWRLQESMVTKRERLDGDRRRWLLRLPLGADALRRDEFRLVEIYRVMDWPPHPPEEGVPPAPSALLSLRLLDGRGRELLRREGGLLPREGPEGFWFHRTALRPEELPEAGR